MVYFEGRLNIVLIIWRSAQPVVCVANLGQLAADLLISSLGLQRVGVFDSSALIPIVGALDTSGKGIIAPLERELNCYIYTLVSH